MNLKDVERTVTIVGFFVIVIMLTVYGSFTAYSIFHPVNETITFNVVGIVNDVNATSLVQVHFECIKYCEQHNVDYNPTKLCFEQCQKLGEVSK